MYAYLKCIKLPNKNLGQDSKNTWDILRFSKDNQQAFKKLILF